MKKMKRRKKAFAASILLCLMLGCGTNRELVVLSPQNQDSEVPPPQNQDSEAPAPENRVLIVLLPDPDGNVGTVRVTTQGGSEILNKPRDATQVLDLTEPPGSPKAMAESEITSVFGPALSAQPDLKDRFVSFILYFQSDSTKLTQESKERLLEVTKAIKNRKSKEVYVVGHTDRVGTEIYNTGLSSRRACYVRDLLVSSGIESSVLIVSFQGETMPQVYTEDEVGEPLNRRVEVFVR